jgi:hypothetical protein
MSIVLQSSGGGQITIQEPATASNFTQTLPAASGEVMVSGNMPAFSAYPNSQQTLSATTYTKILFQTEEFDTNNNYASSTFTPTVAGYYQVSTAINWGTAISRGIVKVYKNGAGFKALSDFQNSTSNAQGGSCLVYCNGSTDYIEIYAYAGAGCTLSATFEPTWFQASMVRAA